MFCSTTDKERSAVAGPKKNSASFCINIHRSTQWSLQMEVLAHFSPVFRPACFSSPLSALCVCVMKLLARVSSFFMQMCERET